MIKLSQPVIPEEAINRVNDILRSGQLVHGEECECFEQELAEYIGVNHAIVVANGTAALHLSLLALGIGTGDAVLVPDFTFVATANAVEIVGAKAIIVDVDPHTYNMDVNLLEERIKTWPGPERLKAIMPVLECGNPSYLQQYRKIADSYGLHLIEDSACAIGSYDQDSKVGTVGDLACFSFHPRKTLTTGEGGLVTTNDGQLADKVKLLRSHGMIRGENGIEFKIIGLNYRLTNFQAAIGRYLLSSLPVWLKKRQILANKYHQYLAELDEKGWIHRPEQSEGHSWQSYMVVIKESYCRDSIIVAMREKGIETNLGAQSMSSLDLFSHPENYKYLSENGNKLYAHGLVLPLHEALSENEIKKISNALTDILTELK